MHVFTFLAGRCLLPLFSHDSQVLHHLSLSETNAQMMNVQVELHTTVGLSCRCPSCPESTVAVQWYRSSDPDAFIKDGKALAWWYEGETGSSQGFGITDDFSMIMYSVNITNKGLYRCIATPYDGAECTSDAKLGIYGKYLFCFHCYFVLS